MSRTDWLRAGLRRLATNGIEGVRVEPLAKELGVTKGSFYWHFEDREELLQAMLRDWEETATEAVIIQAEAAGSEARVRLDRLVGIAAKHFNGQLELELRSWGRRDVAVSKVLRRVDRRRTDYLRQLFRESGYDSAQTEPRAFLAYSMLFGNHLIPGAVSRLNRTQLIRECVDLIGTSS